MVQEYQIIFADAEERKPFQINLALTPAGPQAWGDKLLTDAAVSVEYRDGKIHYEAAIPWRVFPGKLRDAVEKREFLYGIAVNDDDAIVPRRFLERFEGSIVHGKKVDSFARVTLGGEPPEAVDDGISSYFTKSGNVCYSNAEEDCKLSNIPSRECKKAGKYNKPRKSYSKYRLWRRAAAVMMILSLTDLPDPEGPMTTITSPRSMSTVTPSRALMAPRL